MKWGLKIEDAKSTKTSKKNLLKRENVQIKVKNACAVVTSSSSWKTNF